MILRTGHLKQVPKCSRHYFCRSFQTKVETDHSVRASVNLPNPSAAHRDIFWWNSSITRCFRNGDINAARQYFEEMPYKNVVTWNCMISGYVRNARMVEAQKVFDVMPNRDVVSWTALLTGYARFGKVDDARSLFERMPERNVVCWNSMITGYVNSRMLAEARELFDVMPKRNNVSWAVMISGYLRQGLVSEARILFDKVPVKETSLYNILLSGYVDLGWLEEASDLFAKMHQQDAFSWNTMITCYSRAGKMDLARKLFEEIPDKDVITWTAIIRGYLQNGDMEAGRILFDEMPERDIVAWNTMIAGYVQNGMLDDAMRLFQEMPIRDIVSWNTILLGYVEQGDMFNAQLWFHKIPHRNETSWNTLISGCRDEEALLLFYKMAKEGFKPDQGTFTVVISVCGVLVALGCGRMIHLHAIRAGYENDTMVMSSLITMYSKCGLIADSAQVFSCISKKLDTIAWNAMIAAQAYHGLATESIVLFNTMIEAGFWPDHVTFLGLLSACAHGGLVDEGCKYFESMQKDWKLVPEPEHYSCVVDILGRSGSVIDARAFIGKLPLELQSNAWGALLAACTVKGNLELAELAAANGTLYSQPLSGGMYVLLSNIYAAKGRFEDVASIRALMTDRGAKKELACSWLEIKGNMYSFVYHDKSHPQLEEIYKELDNLFNVMKGRN